jgi:hypothetical protein
MRGYTIDQKCQASGNGQQQQHLFYQIAHEKITGRLGQAGELRIPP